MFGPSEGALSGSGCVSIKTAATPTAIAARARKTDGVWYPYWYKKVIKSSSFKPYKNSNESIPKEYNSLLEE